MKQELLDKLIEAEGGYKLINIKNDKGGRTFAGISYRSNPDWVGWKELEYFQENKEITQNVIDKLKPFVRQLYKERYWDTVHLNDDVFDEFPYHEEITDLKNILFHISVLSGPKVAIYCLQNALGKISVDGIWGPNTREKLANELSSFTNYNNEDENNNLESLQRGIALTIISRFVRIVQNDRSQNKFLLGWISRFLKLVG